MFSPYIMSTVSNKRILKNTLMLYVRMMLVMCITLFTSRVILEYLGVEDFGIYNVVGGVIVMMSFFNSTLSSTCQRYFSTDLGKGDFKKLNRDFCLTMSLYLCFIAIVVIACETIGLSFVNSKLVIPDNRMFAANCVYQISLFTFIVSSISIPYNALVISHENMSFYAYLSVVECVLKLAIAFLLAFYGGDRLIYYAILMFITTALTTFVYYLYSKKKYLYIHFRFIWDKKEIKEISSYSGWHLIGAISVLVRNQGVNILINTFFNPAVSAARAISYQVLTATDSLTSNFFTAVKPQIYKSYSSNDMMGMHGLIKISSIVCFFLVGILAIPLITNTEFILALWLKYVPEHTVLFTQLVLINAIIESVNGPSIAAALATGNIKNFEIITGLLMILNLPVSWLLLKLGYAPEMTMIVSIVIAFVTVFVRAYLIERLIGYMARAYFSKVIFPILVIGFFSLLSTHYLSKLISNDWVCLFITIISSASQLILLTFFLCFSKSEKAYLLSLVKLRLYGRKK